MLGSFLNFPRLRGPSIRQLFEISGTSSFGQLFELPRTSGGGQLFELSGISSVGHLFEFPQTSVEQLLEVPKTQSP